MTTVTFAEIAQFRSQLADSPDALQALDLIEDCDGDVEDAAVVLALQAGLEPDRTDRLLGGLAKRCRSLICEDVSRVESSTDAIATIVERLVAEEALPVSLAAPVAIYVLKTGIVEFCHLNP